MLMGLKDAEYFLTLPSRIALKDVSAFSRLVSPHYLDCPKGAIRGLTLQYIQLGPSSVNVVIHILLCTEMDRLAYTHLFSICFKWPTETTNGFHHLQGKSMCQAAFTAILATRRMLCFGCAGYYARVLQKAWLGGQEERELCDRTFILKAVMCS